MSTAARIDELRKKFEENPRRYFAPLANELRKAGNLSEAIALCREFLPKQPEHMSGYIVFGQALYESGDLSEARTVFEQALALDPENLKALRHLGDIAKWEGDTAGARRWYERVLEADPRNDDIAAQLATLATPVHVVRAVPEPEPAVPPVSAFFAPPAASSPAFTPAFSMAPIGLGAIPTPDAALRAVDFDEINARLREPDMPPPEAARAPEPSADSSADVAAVREPELLDLDAIEAAGGDVEPDVAAETEPEAVTQDVVASDLALATETVDETASDDPFGFSDVSSAEVPFEEGLIAPEWPDTSELVARIATPRSVTPSFVAALTPEAVAAFGAEPGESMRIRALDEDALLADIDAQFGQYDAQATADSVVIEGAGELPSEANTLPEDAGIVDLDSDVSEVESHDEIAETLNAMDAVEVEAEAEAEVEAEEVTEVEEATEVETRTLVQAEETGANDANDANDAIDDAEPEWIVATAPAPTHADADELPWLAPAPEPEAVAVEDVAVPEVGAESVAVFSDADAADADAESDSVEASFADVMPEESNPAFVTETMGELLVSQGFTARAVSVYEELVRRRPYDPVLTSRLAELQERLAADVVPAAPAFVTPAAPMASFATPAMGTPAFVASLTPQFLTPLSITPISATPISSPAYDASVFAEESIERVTARERFARLASRRVPRRTPPRASVAVETPADGLASLFGGDAPLHDDLAARALADAFAPIDEISHFGGELPFEEAMLGGTARMATPLRSATPIATAAVPDAGGPFSFDRFFPDPATSPTLHTPAPSPSQPSTREPTPDTPSPKVSDDLAQFSAWLKGLGNT
ncbi:tetratricopeptide repeat protein [Gemmatimonas groenlandica]|uniref:Tetratricopeptide repeat protein n=1 Tax=Gemmatimonas groenlandica TaxID=2732249 RepID=A0A6M4IPP4_9BACT|nr:tetratricopeptide repeat protein [Gemmatimonas groenlandica]QJR34862.1 tetratricopeptide repeat protein [Gemmatimonas groenlandica]